MAITTVLANGYASFSRRLSVVYNIYSQCTLYAPVHKSKRSFTLKLSLRYTIMFSLSLSIGCCCCCHLVQRRIKSNQFICYLLLYEMCAEAEFVAHSYSNISPGIRNNGPFLSDDDDDTDDLRRIVLSSFFRFSFLRAHVGISPWSIRIEISHFVALRFILNI